MDGEKRRGKKRERHCRGGRGRKRVSEVAVQTTEVGGSGEGRSSTRYLLQLG